MGQIQGRFERATATGASTLTKLLNDDIDLSTTHARTLRSMLHDLDQIAATIRLELMNRG